MLYRLRTVQTRRAVILLIMGLMHLGSTVAYAEATKSMPEAKAQAESKPTDNRTTAATAPATPSVIFDPQAYACPQVVHALQQGGEPARTILLWAHGYFSAAYSADEVGPLNAEMTNQLYTGLTDYCQKHPSLNLARAVDALSSE